MIDTSYLTVRSFLCRQKLTTACTHTKVNLYFYITLKDKPHVTLDPHSSSICLRASVHKLKHRLELCVIIPFVIVLFNV